MADSTARSGHPTLADELSEPVLGHETVTVVLDGVENEAGVAAIVPTGSPLFTLRGGELRPWHAAIRGETSSVRPGTLSGFRALIGAVGGDVLFVSDSTLLTPQVLLMLRRGLVADTACATVCVGGASRPVAAGLPPPGVLAPRVGVVLVRRDHLLLALDEAPLVGRPDVRLIDVPADAGIVHAVLATLARPGFIHRAVSGTGDTPPPPPGRLGSAAGRAAAEVVLDGRCLAEPLSGTQVQVLGLAGGLLRAGANVAVLRPTELHSTVASEVGRIGGELQLVDRARVGRPEVFHRPFQIRSLHELADCLSIGDRLVLTHQDMIRDRTPAYASTAAAWEDYRSATDAALSSADEVGFFSKHAAIDAASEGPLELDRATVVHLGVDHVSDHADLERSLDPLRGMPYLLVVGNAFWHKNRLFALRLLDWLIDTSAWDGGLVLAGEDPGRGSSVAAEKVLVRETAHLRGRVVDLGRVSDADQVALYRAASLVVFPSLYEGFGLIPFEAAHFGTASVYTHCASMRELLPDTGALPSFDLDEAGPFVLSLLESDAARKRVVAEIAAVASGLTWDRAAAGYLEVYGRALAREPRNISRLLLGVVPSGRKQLTRQEVVLLDVYRRRRGFRLAVDGLLRTGSVALHGARQIRRKESP